MFLGLRREKSIICGLYLPCLPGMFTCAICKPPLTLTWCKSKGIDCEPLSCTTMLSNTLAGIDSSRHIPGCLDTTAEHLLNFSYLEIVGV